MNDAEIRLPGEALQRGVIALAIAILVIAPWPRATAGAGWRQLVEPAVTADPATLASQRDGIERAIARAYAGALDQLRRARQLQLAISASQADDIEARAVADLRQLRREALAEVARALAMTPSAAARFIADAEARSDTGAQVGDASVLLAPSLTAIAARTAQVASQLADDATRALTAAPPRTASPSPRSSPTASPR